MAYNKKHRDTYVNVYWELFDDCITTSVVHPSLVAAEGFVNDHKHFLGSYMVDPKEGLEVYWGCLGELVVNGKSYKDILHPWINSIGMEATLEHLQYMENVWRESHARRIV